MRFAFSSSISHGASVTRGSFDRLRADRRAVSILEHQRQPLPELDTARAQRRCRVQLKLCRIQRGRCAACCEPHGHRRARSLERLLSRAATVALRSQTDDSCGLYLDFFQQMQALIARSEPSECVALFSTQLLPLTKHERG